MKIGVVGAGLMGSGIAQTCSQAGYEAVNYDSYPDALPRAKAGVAKDMKKLVERGKFTEEHAESVEKRITYTSDIEDLRECGIIIEAIFEDFEVKKSIFQQLDAMMPSETILCSNTSTISITAIAACTNRPERVMGTHFFSPVPVMKLLELIRGMETSDETFKVVEEFGRNINKVVVNAPDFSGFITNRILPLCGKENCKMIARGVSPEDFDKTMSALGRGSMSAMELADFSGLDVLHGCLKSLHAGLKMECYRTPLLLEQMVESGYLGRKSGRGYFKYTR